MIERRATQALYSGPFIDGPAFAPRGLRRGSQADPHRLIFCISRRRQRPRTTSIKFFKMRHGGKRQGSGRKRGGIGLQRVTPEIKQELREVARKHAEKAIRALVKICETGKSESAHVAAASALLDRGYGKPGQHIDVTGTHKFSRMTDEELMAILEEPLEIPAISNGRA